MISEDGTRWTVGDAGMNVPLYGLTWTNGMFIAVGKEVLTSPDGENWTPQAWDAGLSLNGVAWNGSDYVAVGDEILTSADGITWIAAKPMADRPAGSMRDVLWNGEQFLAVGDSGTVITSPDGENWTVRSPAPADEPERAPSTESIPDAVSSLAHLTAVAWRGPQAGSPGRFVAVGTDSAGGAAVPVWTSPDGLAWTPGDFGSALPFATANGVASNGQRYVAVGVANDLPSSRSRRRGARKGFVSDSADGVSWGARNSGELGMPNGIAWDGGAYLAVGENGRIAGSLDGSLWSAMRSGTSKTLRRIAAANGNLVAVGDRGTILRSPSGAKWRKSASKSRSDLRGVAFTGNRWIAVGTGKTVLSSACNQR
jgi:hypothetical protein